MIWNMKKKSGRGSLAHAPKHDTDEKVRRIFGGWKPAVGSHYFLITEQGSPCCHWKNPKAGLCCCSTWKINPSGALWPLWHQEELEPHLRNEASFIGKKGAFQSPPTEHAQYHPFWRNSKCRKMRDELHSEFIITESIIHTEYKNSQTVFNKTQSFTSTQLNSKHHQTPTSKVENTGSQRKHQKRKAWRYVMK